MATRTKPEFIRAVIEVPPDTDLTRAIRTANVRTNNLVTEDTGGELNSDTLEQIETYLAAYYYSIFDPQYKSKTTGDASAVYVDREDNPWLKAAFDLDITGNLRRIKLKMHWLGTEVAAQVDYWDRN
jgi:hypothetical protein